MGGAPQNIEKKMVVQVRLKTSSVATLHFTKTIMTLMKQSFNVIVGYNQKLNRNTDIKSKTSTSGIHQ